MKTPSVIKKLIDNGMIKTSVTAVLIGDNTANRRWVNYEIVKSFDKGNGLIGIHINRIRVKHQIISARGLNPLDRLGFLVSEDGSKIHFYELKNRKWEVYSDLPMINNKKSNTIYFSDHWCHGNEYGKFFRFSEKFDAYCWILDDGHKKFSGRIEEAAEQAGR